MSLTDIDIAIATEKRLGWDASKRLTLMSYIPAAMSNLAKQVARDPSKRNLLMTDPDTVSVTLTAGVLPSSSADATTTGTADLSTIVNTYDIMLDCLKYGTIFLQYQIPWDSGDVSTGTWPSGGFIEIQGAAGILTDALPVYMQTAGTMPSGLSEDTTYYIIADNPDYGFATTAANAAVPTGITLVSAGSGNGTIYSFKQTLQWLQSPQQGLSTTCLPFSMPQCWLQGYDIYVKDATIWSTFAKLMFCVPYVPTPENFPDDENLREDLIDVMVGLAMTAGVEDVPPNS